MPDGAGELIERTVIAGDDFILRHIVSPFGHRISDTPDVDGGVLRGDEVKVGAIPPHLGFSQQVDFDRRGHDSFESE